MKKIITAVSAIIIHLFTLSVFGWMSVHASKGDKDFGLLNEPTKFMYSFFDQFIWSAKEVKKLSPTFMPIWSKITPVNKLESNVNILMSYSESAFRRAVVIKNLKNDSILYKWDISEKASQWDRIVNPFVFPNKDLVYFFTDKSGLRRIDSLGNFKWKQDKFLAHHSLNIDSTGNFWVCSKNPPKNSPGGVYKIDGRNVYYDDDCVTRIDANNGEILFHRSITDILKTNNLANYILQATPVKDPIHLNDIQPALKTTQYYNEGDIFLSIKQSSMLLHYRPSTNKVIKVIEGAFSAQHDIDFLNDTTLTIFNNNSYPLWVKDSKPKPQDNVKLVNAGNFSSNIARYDFGTGKISYIGDSLFRANKIFTSTEGLHEFINDSTYFIEEQNVGCYWVIQGDEVVYKNVFKSQHSGHSHLPNWARIIQ